MSEVIVEPGIDPAEIAAPEEPAWTGPSQEDWGSVQQTLGYLAEYVQSQQAPAEEGYPEIDPYDTRQLGEFIQQQVQQSLEPVTNWQQQQALGEAEDRAVDIIQDDVSRNGEFLLGEKAYANVRALANSYMEEEAQRHGFGPKAAESALSRAAGEWREYEKELATIAIERHMNQLTNLSGAGREPGVSSVAAQQVVSTPGGDEMSLVRKYGGFPGS